MDFEPSPEQRRLMELATRLATEVSATLPRDAIGFATEAYAALGKGGHFAAKTTLDATLVVLSLAKESASLGATFAAGWLFIDALRRHGTGRPLAAAAEAGTRAGAVVLPKTETELIVSDVGEMLRFAGTATQVPLAPVASDALVAARLANGDAVLACVDLAASGIQKGAHVPALGLVEFPRGVLDLGAASVGRDRVLARGDGAASAARALVRTRSLLWAAVAVGVAGRALAGAVGHVRRAGKVRQSTEFVLSDLATGYDAAFLATVNAAWQRDQGNDTDAESAGAKLLAARIATEVSHGALTIAGEGGLDGALGRAYLDARYLELYDGAEAAQVDLIASQMLGES